MVWVEVGVVVGGWMGWVDVQLVEGGRPEVGVGQLV